MSKMVVIDGVLTEVDDNGIPIAKSVASTDSTSKEPLTTVVNNPGDVSVETLKANASVGDVNFKETTHPAGEVLPSDLEKKDEVKKEERVRTYLHGNDYFLLPSELEKYKKLNEELNEVLGDRNLSDVPLGDAYYEKKKALDLFVASLRK